MTTKKETAQSLGEELGDAFLRDIAANVGGYRAPSAPPEEPVTTAKIEPFTEAELSAFTLEPDVEASEECGEPVYGSNELRRVQRLLWCSRERMVNELLRLRQREGEARALLTEMDDYLCHNMNCVSQSAGYGGGKCDCGVKVLGERLRAFLADGRG